FQQYGATYKSYIFGYEKDNPSDEFLKTSVFGIHSHSNQHQHTLYTINLEGAKSFFKDKLCKITHEDISLIFKKLTQKLKFNLYEINEEIDVFVTFETMNHRGKPLTSLELLKNRLIYLSTLFKEHKGADVLRDKINNAWKTIYEYLGKNPDKPLDDNLFLRNHWTMYFTYSRKKGDDYIKDLLNEHFTVKNVIHSSSDSSKVTVEKIDKYITNLQQSIRYWFYIHNPRLSEPVIKDEKNQLFLDRLERLSFRAFKPLLLASYTAKRPIEEINRLLEAAERYNFTLFTMCKRRANTGDAMFFDFAHKLLFKDVTIDSVIWKINELIGQYYDPNSFLRHIEEKYKFNNRDGFYRWEGLRYFLFEHEEYLKNLAKTYTQELNWHALSKNKKDHVTIEHIFPQTPTDDYWQEKYDNFNEEQIIYLSHSLGNLLPLSRAKNSSLQNDAFQLKKNNGNGIGYYNGSVSENEIAQNENWLAENILQRGMDLLEFMELRWKIDLGDDSFKRRLLHIDFLSKEDF
ncbi:MAG: DUF1524 domain-containing protein, partial [Alphaproteobacteria bacterium]|nr:DUF1524 domain-containing protein [Alphaproteobacteria bacterium]